MARVLGLDLETTGLDIENDRITEIGVVIWDTDTHTPLFSRGFFISPNDYMRSRFNDETLAVMRDLCGITVETLEEFGVPIAQVLNFICTVAEKHEVEYVVAHNGNNFDKPLLKAEFKQNKIESTFFDTTPWIDTKEDLPWNVPGPRGPHPKIDSNRLKHLALELGFINPFPHRAETDVLTMLRVMSAHRLEDILAYRAIPNVIVRAVVNYDRREEAKAQRFSWEKIGDKTYPKMWVKRMKKTEYEEQSKTWTFESAIIEQL